jgi:hypothetical protein
MARVRQVRSVIALASLLLSGSAFAAPAKPTAAPPSQPSPAVTPITTEPTPAEPTAPVEPEVEPDAPTTEPPAPVRADPAAVAALQQDARALRDALFKARGRVSLVAAKLFTTRVSLRLRSNFDRFYTVSNLTLRIDGAPVYVQDAGMPSTDGDLFDVFAAPGSHELSVSADLVARRDATYKIRIDHTLVLLREAGNMWKFAKNNRGHSDLHIGVRAKAKRTVKRGAGKTKTKAKLGGTTVGTSAKGGTK